MSIIEVPELWHEMELDRLRAENAKLRAALNHLTHWADILSRELNRPELDKAIDEARTALNAVEEAK